MGLRNRVGVHRCVAAVTAVMAVGALAACGDDDEGDSGSGEGATITIAGPNQWNNDAQTFGPFWETLTSNFQEETGITVETTVMPIADFAQTTSTQLAAGTAPELVFNQPPHEPYMVVPLDEYMEQPNPFIEGNERWYDAFDQRYYGYDAGSANGEGNLEWVPFNLISLGIFYNMEAFEEAGVQAPLETFGDYLTACDQLTEAGYDPFAMDSSFQGQGQVTNFIYNMLMAKYFDELNQFEGTGEPGQADTLVIKSQMRAILTGEVDATTTPEVAETLRLTKEFMDRCATPNWSGVPAAAGGFVNTGDFVSETAAMALGSNLAAADGVLEFEYGTMPFGTVSEADSPLSEDFGAQSGLSAGGTSYMISSTTEGEQLDAAIQFLQYVSSPMGAQPFLDASGGLPAIVDAEPAPGLEGITSDEDWTQPLLMGSMPVGPQATVGQPIIDGYLIGDETLEQQLTELEQLWQQNAREQAELNGWTEDWAQAG